MSRSHDGCASSIDPARHEQAAEVGRLGRKAQQVRLCGAIGQCAKETNKSVFDGMIRRQNSDVRVDGLILDAELSAHRFANGLPELYSCDGAWHVRHTVTVYAKAREPVQHPR